MKIRNYKLKIVISIFVIFLLLSVANSSDAAELFFDVETQEIGINQQFQVDLFLDTENEEINAVEGKIVFPNDNLELKEIREGDSVINFWIEKPKRESDNQIIFSGIIPGGFGGVLGPDYSGVKPGRILSLVFLAKNIGQGAIEINNAKVLLNDGRGTAASLSISNFQFSVTHEAPQIRTPIDTKKDTDPPEAFIPEIAQDPNIFDGKYFLVFATQDKRSGIDRYEIQETRNKRQGKNWVEAGSPYVLKDQKLRSYIYVKAIDKAGNERIAVVEPRYPMKWYENYLIWIIIISGVIVLCIIGKILWKKKIVH